MTPLSIALFALSATLGFALERMYYYLRRLQVENARLRGHGEYLVRVAAELGRDLRNPPAQCTPQSLLDLIEQHKPIWCTTEQVLKELLQKVQEKGNDNG